MSDDGLPRVLDWRGYEWTFFDGEWGCEELGETRATLAEVGERVGGGDFYDLSGNRVDTSGVGS